MKRLKALLPLMLLALLVWKCQKDDGPLSPPHKSAVEIQTLTLEELNQKESLKGPLEKMHRVLDVNKKKASTSKVTATDGSFTVLTKEIVELTTSNSKSYSFRTETPVFPEADFENLVIYKKEREAFKFYLYSYKYIFFEGEWRNYIISIIPIDAAALGLDNLVEDFTAKQVMANNCLWNIAGDDITLIWCFGSNDQGGLDGQEGSLNPSYGCDDWVYFNPDGIGKCIRTRSCVDSNGNLYSTTEYGVDCNGNVVHGNEGGGNDELNNDNNDNDFDDNWGIEDGPVNDGPVNGGGSSNDNEDEEVVPVNPPVDYVQAAEMCLGFMGGNYNIPQDAMEDLGKYTYENGCDAFALKVANEMENNNWAFEQDYKGRMSISERAIYDSMSRFKQVGYLLNAQKATWVSEDLYPNSLYNGKGDAFRHAYFNGLNAILLGPTLAEDLATAHEDKPAPLNYPNYFKEVQMDLFNNAVGRNKRNWLSDGYDSLTESIQDAMVNGELRYLSNLHPALGTNEDYRATYNSQLIPSNQ